MRWTLALHELYRPDPVAVFLPDAVDNLPLSLPWAPATVLRNEVPLISNSFHLSSLAALFHLLSFHVKSQLLHGTFSLHGFSSLSETAWQMFTSSVIFTFKKFIIFVLVSVLQSDFEYKKSPVLTLVLVNPFPLLWEKWSGTTTKQQENEEKKKEIIWSGKALWILMYV